MRSPVKALILPLAFAPLTLGWAVTSYYVVSSITTELVPDYNQTETLTLTGPLSVSPVKETVTYRTDYFQITDNGIGRAVVNITTSEVTLPTGVDLPTAPSTARPERTTPTIETYYYAKAILSNPSSCTKTSFTYTESVGVRVPTSLISQATESDLVEHVTTYVSTISTNLGGQAVTTSRCDVYFKADAVPVDDDMDVAGGLLLSECVDPRRSVCTAAGENSEAKGAGGCNGPYPPTAAGDGDEASSTGDAANPTQTDGAGSWRDQRVGTWVIVLCAAVLSLVLI